jgi:predicted metalloprotease
MVVGLGAAAYFMMPSLMSGGGGPVDKQADDTQAAFIKTVHADSEKVWSNIFARAGLQYEEPVLVLYRGTTSSGCGTAQSAMGPFYCPNDHKVYIDLAFYHELQNKFGASGDFAQAYVLAHEIGHHIQNLAGTLDKVEYAKRRASGGKGNQLQVSTELQADCYAGVWANHAQQEFHMLEQGDLEEALNAANAIGDDNIQRKSQGFVVPHSFTHGSSKQRKEWFSRGLKNGDLNDCQTFG